MRGDYAKERPPPFPRAVFLSVLTIGILLGATVIATREDGRGGFGGNDDLWIAEPQPPQPLDVNKASAEQLDSLPSMSPQMARGIVQMRPFESVDALIAVKGIGPKNLEKIRPYLFVTTNQVQGIP